MKLKWRQYSFIFFETILLSTWAKFNATGHMAYGYCIDVQMAYSGRSTPCPRFKVPALPSPYPIHPALNSVTHVGALSTGPSTNQQRAPGIDIDEEGGVEEALEGARGGRPGVHVGVVHAARFGVLGPQQLEVDALVAAPVQPQRRHQDEQLQDAQRRDAVHLSQRVPCHTPARECSMCQRVPCHTPAQPCTNPLALLSTHELKFCLEMFTVGAFVSQQELQTA